MSHHSEQPMDQVVHTSGQRGSSSSLVVYPHPYQCIPHPVLMVSTYAGTFESHPLYYQYRDQSHNNGMLSLPNQEVLYHPFSSTALPHQQKSFFSAIIHPPKVEASPSSSRHFQAISNKVLENTNATWKATKDVVSCHKEKETKVATKEIPVSNRNTKTILNRYDSDDSGVVESASSSVSEPSSLNFDENTSSEDELWNERSSSVGNKSSTSQISKDIEAPFSEKSLHEETSWTVAMDDLYWRKMKRKLPCENLITTIANQVDYYLSDDYLVRDRYMLRQVRCKKDGYVSIKLLTSFKRLKKLTKDWTTVRSAIVRKSQILAVSEEGLRVRRRSCLSEDLRKPRLVTSVLAIRVPEEYNFVKKVNTLFRPFGELDYVRLIRPNSKVPADLRNYATQVPDIGQSLCAVVNYESAQDALMAVKVLNHLQKPSCTDKTTDVERTGAWQSSVDHYKDIFKDQPSLAGMRLALLGPRVRRTLYKRDRAKTDEDNDAIKSREEERYTDLSNSRCSSNSHFQTSFSPPSVRCRPVVVKTNPKQVFVIRQPKGPENDKGFRFKRSILPAMKRWFE